MSYNIIGKYIKDLDFKIPNPQMYSSLSKEIADYKINIDIKSNQIKEKLVEIETSLSLITEKKSAEKLSAKIVLSTIIEISKQSIDKHELEKIILIKVPSAVYPELRKIFLFLFENSGFKEIKINENVDFENLYKIRKNQ